MATVSLDEALRLAIAQHQAGRLREAEAIYLQLLQQQPRHARAAHLMGVLTGQVGQLDSATDWLERSLEMDPTLVDARGDLGNVYFCQGNVPQAIAAYRRAVELAPDRAYIHSNLLYALYFHPTMDAPAIFAEHQHWQRMHAANIEAQPCTHANARDPDKPLRIGYVSPHFRAHPVARFLLALLRAHDRQNFAAVCYHSGPIIDSMTARLQQQSTQWRSITGLSDAAAADLMAADGIDLLVDLTMHMDGCRPLIFARRPAPVQVAYLAYCGTTGLHSIDYRLSDPHLDPTEISPPIYSEKTIRLPDTYWCYEPLENSPDVAIRHSDTPLTFGCLNNFTKVSEAALLTWAKIMAQAPGSRLILHAHPGKHRQRATRVLAEKGIAEDRIEFVGMLPAEDYLRHHAHIDIALDPFPYGGGTTTCDALWMGVPVVTLIGNTAVGRGGLSILSNIGLPDLIATNQSQYAAIATALARDPGRRMQLRTTMRQRMQNSPLMDATRFARAVEAAYRDMWRRWAKPAV